MASVVALICHFLQRLSMHFLQKTINHVIMFQRPSIKIGKMVLVYTSL